MNFFSFQHQVIPQQQPAMILLTNNSINVNSILPYQTFFNSFQSSNPQNIYTQIPTQYPLQNCILQYQQQQLLQSQQLIQQQLSQSQQPQQQQQKQQQQLINCSQLEKVQLLQKQQAVFSQQQQVLLTPVITQINTKEDNIDQQIESKFKGISSEDNLQQQISVQIPNQEELSSNKRSSQFSFSTTISLGEEKQKKRKQEFLSDGNEIKSNNQQQMSDYNILKDEKDELYIPSLTIKNKNNNQNNSILEIDNLRVTRLRVHSGKDELFSSGQSIKIKKAKSKKNYKAINCNTLLKIKPNQCNQISSDNNMINGKEKEFEQDLPSECVLPSIQIEQSLENNIQNQLKQNNTQEFKRISKLKLSKVGDQLKEAKEKEEQLKILLIEELNDDMKEVVQEFINTNRQNINRNILKQFVDYVETNINYTLQYQQQSDSIYYYKSCLHNQIIRNNNPNEEQKILFQKKFKKFMRTKKHSNLHIKQIISNNIYGELFSSFITNSAIKWAIDTFKEEERLQEYLLLIKFYELCCQNQKYLLFMNDTLSLNRKNILYFRNQISGSSTQITNADLIPSNQSIQ